MLITWKGTKMINWNTARVTWNNGVWKLFDVKNYQDIEPFGSLQELKGFALSHGKIIY